MNPILFTFWGPFAIHAYGLCIAVGVFLAFVLMLRDKKLQQIVTIEELVTGIQLIILSGYLGGRIGFLLSEAHSWSDCWLLLQFWQPGLSILGGVITSLIALYWYVKIYKISALPYIDRLVIYAPFVQGFGRLGCFFAGCCYGLQTDRCWAVMYSHSDHMAPLGIFLHPTQLYSGAILFIIFLLFYFVVQYRVKMPGILLCLYLLLVGMERFFIDFFRGDRVFFKDQCSYFSVHQLVALGLIVCACMGMWWLQKQSKKSYGSV